MQNIVVTITRPCCVRGKPLPLGRAELPPDDADALVQAGKAKLLNIGDAAHLDRARAAAAAGALGASYHGPGPWARA